MNQLTGIVIASILLVSAPVAVADAKAIVLTNLKLEFHHRDI